MWRASTVVLTFDGDHSATHWGAVSLSPVSVSSADSQMIQLVANVTRQEWYLCGLTDCPSLVAATPLILADVDHWE